MEVKRHNATLPLNLTAPCLSCTSVHVALVNGQHTDVSPGFLASSSLAANSTAVMLHWRGEHLNELSSEEQQQLLSDGRPTPELRWLTVSKI